MAEFFNRQWRLPNNKNKNKVSNYSLQRNGTSQYVQSDNIPFNSGPSWTISCWVKGANLTSGTTEAFYGTQYYGTTTGGFVIYFKNGGLTFYSSLPGSGSYFTIATATGLLSNNEWQQFVIRYNYGVDYRVYVNNVLRGVNTLNNTKIWPEQNIRLFRHYANDGYSYIGEMTDWCFFNYALSDTSTTVGDTATDQVAAIYGDGSSLPNPMAFANPPVAYYPLGDQDVYNGADYLVPNASLQDYVFDFSSDVIDTNSLGISGANARTISCWFNADNTSDQNIIGFGAASSGNNFTIAIYNNNIFAHTWNIGGAGGDLSGSAVTASKWHLAVMTYDGSNLKISLDGGTYATTSASLNTTNSVFKIGSSYYTNWNNFSGKISNTKVWNTDLSQAEVTTLYNYGSPIQTLASIPQNTNLKAWYKLNASATFDGSNWSIPDDSTNSNTGTSSGMTQSALQQSDLQHTSGYSPYALQLDGTSNYIDCGNDSSLNIYNNITISAWIKANSFGAYNLIIGRSTDKDYDLGVYSTASGGAIRFHTGDGTQENVVSTGTFLNTGVWYHVAVTRTTSPNQAIFFINGQQLNTAALALTPTGSTDITRIGGRSGSYGFNGQMSNVSIWNAGLTSSQITELYNSGVPSNLNNHSAVSSLISWWQLGSNSSFNNTVWTCLDEKGTNNGVSSTNMSEVDIVNGVGYSSNGVSSGMSDNLKGYAPYSTANSLSVNMDVLDRTTDVPS